MLNFLWLIPALPFAGFLRLVFIGPRLSKTGIALTGVGSVAISTLISIMIGVSFISSPPPDYVYTQTLWNWVHVGKFMPGISLYLDTLSLVMISVITVVSFLILLYSVRFMSDEEGYSRFFAYMNLFVGSMLTLVLADNLLLLYLGWEGVGLCSYLLIGFWYKDAANGKAARKAFIVTRIGDTALAIGIFVIFNNLGTLQIQELMKSASQNWPVGSSLALVSAALILGGAVGKSAQLPLQTWLPDAMAGPTPVSALIHAATMVTAGVYLIARTHLLFTLAPVVQSAVALIGAATLLLAGFSALTQLDIKKVLAYSTMSQIGYMFLALGVGAWSAALFHFMTHAFFKALLFLGAGVIIKSLNDEHNILKMGGLRKQLPLTFWTFLIGATSLSALPLVTAGFYSKDLILLNTWLSGKGGPGLWAVGLAGAFITSLYTFRMVFYTFFGETKTRADIKPDIVITIPLIVLAFFSVISGFLELPQSLGNVRVFSHLIEKALPALSTVYVKSGTKLTIQVIAEIVPLVGVFLSYIFFLRRTEHTKNVLGTQLGRLFNRFWYAGWGFDWLYEVFILKPFVWIANINRDDFIDLTYLGIGWLNLVCHRIFSRTQTGLVRWYAMGIGVGAIITMAIVAFS